METITKEEVSEYTLRAERGTMLSEFFPFFSFFSVMDNRNDISKC